MNPGPSLFTRSCSPYLEIFLVFVPIYLDADRVSFHFVKIGRESADAVIEFPPKQLADEADGRLRFRSVETPERLVELMPEETGRQASEFEVGTQHLDIRRKIGISKYITRKTDIWKEGD